MRHDALTLTTYFGERDRAVGGMLADALMAAYARRGLRAGLLLRGSAGFGVRHHLRTDRLLTLSEDLPLVAMAVDAPEVILAAAEETAAHTGEGLITLERASTAAVAAAPGEEAKLTVFLGRRGGGVALVDLLRRHGVAGASVLLGVDGTAHGRRRRARFAGSNRHVPLIVVAVGAMERIAAALPEADALLGEPVRTLERVRVCKRDGATLAAPHADAPPGWWQKLTVICGEQSRHDGEPLADALIRGLRSAGAAGDRAARHLGLPRRPRAARRYAAPAAPPRARRDHDGRHAGAQPRVVRADRRADAHRRAGALGARARVPRHRAGDHARRPPARRPGMTRSSAYDAGSRRSSSSRTLRWTSSNERSRLRSTRSTSRSRRVSSSSPAREPR